MKKKTKVNIDELKSKISSAEKDLKDAEKKLEQLHDKKLKVENPVLLKEENDVLDLTHQANVVDIKLYNEKILKLEKELKKSQTKLLKLREENTKLKKDKNINKEEPNKNKNTILNLKDLYQSINFQIIEETKEDNNDTETTNEEENIKMEKEEIINKKIKEYEKIFEELKETANKINYVKYKQRKKNRENRNYLNEVQCFIVELRERINISINNEIIENENKNKNIKLKDYNILFEEISNLLFELDNILLNNKDTSVQNIEYNFTNIQENINNLNLEENKKEFNFKNKCEELDQIINSIKKAFNDFEQTKEIINSKSQKLEEQIKQLKSMYDEKEFNQYKEKEKIRQAELKEKEKNDKEKKEKKGTLGSSLVYRAKNTSEKLNIYTTVNIFKNKDELSEELDKSKLLRKNYHEICYIYDEYDMHDIYYTLKAIVLPNQGSFSLASFYFPGLNKIQIQEFDLDDIATEYKQEGNVLISFKIELHNMESIKVHIKYKEIRDSSILSNEEGKKENKIYRSDSYGLDSSLSGANAKYSLILKGNYDIINFEDYFLIRNTNNTVDVEYMWGGVVPPKGKTTKITFSKREVNWSFERVIKFHSNSLIKRSKFFIPIEFVGGNNEIIKVTPTSAQASNITLDEKKRQYVINYKNTKYKKGEIIIKGEFKNICKGGWNVDLTDKEIEALMPEEDVKDKEALKKVAQDIIEEFDKENKDSDFEYLDYMKIGIWIKHNIKYNYGFIGKKCSALKIYKMKAGVSYHYTRLSNALLYSLGYKVLYASGYLCKNSNKFNQYNLHAFSLIKLDDNKWHPFDVTSGIFTGKLHVGYVFRMFDNRDLVIENKNNIVLDKNEISGKVIN